MNLIWRIFIRISLTMCIIMAVWALLFRRAIIDEVNDETDDSLELFSENLINRVLSGQEMPAADNGTNNTYFLDSITEEYAQTHPHVAYSDEIIFIREKNENEPARVLRTVFRDDHGNLFLLTVAIPSLETEDLQEALTGWIATLYVGLLILTIFIIMWVLWRNMRPLYVLLKWVDNYDISEGIRPLTNPTKVKEFIQLNDAIIRSAQRSEQLFNQQKQFTGNASHEIQTPLAVCRNRLDLLLNTDLSEEQMGELIKVQQSLDYISRLNKELLLLTKIDGRQFSDSQPLNISHLVNQTATDCAMIYQHNCSEVVTQTDTPLEVRMNSTLASVMVTNLIKNAFVHNLTTSAIHISTTQRTLLISNGGMQPLDADKVFNRFYHQNKREGSTGLGLAIVKAITDLYGFALTYEYRNERHHFIIKM